MGELVDHSSLTQTSCGCSICQFGFFSQPSVTHMLPCPIHFETFRYPLTFVFLVTEALRLHSSLITSSKSLRTHSADSYFPRHQACVSSLPHSLTFYTIRHRCNLRPPIHITRSSYSNLHFCISYSYLIHQESSLSYIRLFLHFTGGSQSPQKRLSNYLKEVTSSLFSPIIRATSSIHNDLHFFHIHYRIFLPTYRYKLFTNILTSIINGIV